MYGGNGDDIIYGSYKAGVLETSVLAGQGGKDLIRTDIYETGDNQREFIVFGDWGYGEDGSYDVRANGNQPFIQYGDPTFEKKLWGDDDTIIFGDATNNFSSAQKFYAGDGDDTVTMGDEYRKSYGFGGRGDDIINLPGSFIGNAAS